MIVTFPATARSRAATRSPRSISRRVDRSTVTGPPYIHARHPPVTQSWHLFTLGIRQVNTLSTAREPVPLHSQPRDPTLSSTEPVRGITGTG